MSKRTHKDAAARRFGETFVKPAPKAEPPKLETSFTAHIMRFVDQILKANPDARSNSELGRLYGEAFIWETLSSLADKKRKQVWDQLITGKHVAAIPDAPGDYELGSSAHFVAKVVISAPVRRFSEDELCALLSKSKYKIPAPFAKEMVQKAKVPTTSTVTKKIAERSVSV